MIPNPRFKFSLLFLFLETYHVCQNWHIQPNNYQATFLHNCKNSKTILKPLPYTNINIKIHILPRTPYSLTVIYWLCGTNHKAGFSIRHSDWMSILQCTATVMTTAAAVPSAKSADRQFIFILLISILMPLLFQQKPFVVLSASNAAIWIMKLLSETMTLLAARMPNSFDFSLCDFSHPNYIQGKWAHSIVLSK